MATSSTSSWFTSSNAALKTNFCPECGSLLPLPGVTGKIVCSICEYSCTTDDLLTKEIVTRSKGKDTKRIVAKALNEAAIVKDGSVVCPECDHHELSFKTAQLRSADEGQTIFYECTKCKFTWSVNT